MILVSDTELKTALRRLIKEVGATHVCAALVMEGLSARQAELLSKGDHKIAFRRKTVTAVEAVLEKQGKEAS